MDGCYAETLVKRNVTKSSIAKKFLLIGLCVSFGVLTLVFFLMLLGVFAIISLAICAVLIFVTVYYIPRLDVEWEYVFVDGQLDFDQILGGNARKRVKRIDFEQTEIVAKSDSHHLDQYSRMTMKNLDYSSLFGNPTYTIICHEGNDLLRIVFEPDENMIEVMRNKSPRKVKKD